MYILFGHKKSISFAKIKIKTLSLKIQGLFHWLFDTYEEVDPEGERLEEMTVEDLDVLDDLISDLDDE